MDVLNGSPLTGLSSYRGGRGSVTRVPLGAHGLWTGFAKLAGNRKAGNLKLQQ